MNRETGPPESLAVFFLGMILSNIPVPTIRKFAGKPISNWKSARNDAPKFGSTTGRERNTVGAFMKDMIINLIASLTQSFGGSLGCAILIVSLGIRAAL